MKFARGSLALLGLLLAGSASAATQSFRATWTASTYGGYVQFYDGATCSSRPSGSQIQASSLSAACAAKAAAMRNQESSDPCYSYTSSLSTVNCGGTWYNGTYYPINYSVCNITTGTAAAAGTTCRSSTGVCDPAETCNGTSTCPADVFTSSSTVCRTANGLCDVPEYCTGSSGSCPGNGFASAGTVCRASTMSCDPQETCSGNSSSCPSDTRADLSSDEANCGACGNTCGSGQQCCDYTCRSTQTDLFNCGTCGKQCEASCSGIRACTSGNCTPLATYDYTVLWADTKCFRANPSERATSSTEANACFLGSEWNWNSSQYVWYPEHYKTYRYCAKCYIQGTLFPHGVDPWATNEYDAQECAQNTYPDCQISAGACP